jgi:hypothetical protein
VLVKGSASLYYFPVTAETCLFIETQETGIIAISGKETNYHGEDHMNRVHLYQSRLQYVLRRCPSIQNRIMQTNDDIASMISLVRKYNDCIAGRSEYIHNPDRRSFIEIGPVLLWEKSGFAYLHARILGKIEGIDKIRFTSSTSFGFGAYADFMNMKSGRKSSVRIYSYLIRADYHCINEPIILNGNSSDYRYDQIRTSFSDIFFSLQLTRYISLKNGHRFNFEIGPCFGLPLDTYNSYIQYRETNLTFPGNGSITWRKHLTHSSTIGISGGLQYLIPYHKNRPFVLFAQGGYASYIISSIGNSGYMMRIGVRLDLY